jgi:hypothetical protein
MPDASYVFYSISNSIPLTTIQLIRAVTAVIITIATEL